MTFLNAKYLWDEKLQENFAITATVNGVDISVPLDPANSDYAEIMRQVEAGELTIQEADS